MLDTPIESLPKTHSRTISLFKKLGILTYCDLLMYAPMRYEDFRAISPISHIRPYETVTIHGEIESIKNQYLRRGMTIQSCVVKDETGSISATWFNQKYLSTILKKGSNIALSGEVKPFRNSLSLHPTSYETLDGADPIHTSRIVPVYSQIRGLSSKTIREKIYYVLSKLAEEEINDPLPKTLVRKEQLASYSYAIKTIHFPDNFDDQARAQNRLAFDELFIRMLSSRLVKKEWEESTSPLPISIDNKQKQILNTFIHNLPFTLTDDQKKCIREIRDDLTSTHPMNRFLHGDVGSGKTIVCAIAGYVVSLNDQQTLFMAPTEVLAQQHFATLKNLFKNENIAIGIQTGSEKSLKKHAQSQKKFDIIVGTHALLSNWLSFETVGLIVIDEQHRFGVKQRALLRKKGAHPHVLTMTATPIPRTVLLTMYSELDLSVIHEMPKGRKSIKSRVVPKHKRNDAYAWIQKHIQMGDQVFVVCPFVQQSEKETMQSVKAVTKEFQKLDTQIFANEKVGLLHGRMKAKEKKEVMSLFAKKKIDVLVCTSVVEVGIDIPNATIMVIEGAERFGMAQLHQLRGRVGRGEKQSYCLLFTSDSANSASQRLQYFASHQSGLELAEYDFKQRGPGVIHGTQQHGYSDLKLANLADTVFVKKVTRAVDIFLKEYSIQDYPIIQSMLETYNIEHIARD